MENASKALLIAGGVLITILVITLGVYFSQSMANQVSEIYKQLEEHNRTEFNQKFLNFNDRMKKNDAGYYEEDAITIQDVATLINLAKDANESNELDNVTPPTDPSNDTSLYVTVDLSAYESSWSELLNGTSYTLAHAERFPDKLVDELVNKVMVEQTEYSFYCTINTNNNTGYVNEIIITSTK